MTEIYYADPAKQAKLEEAIARGFIIRTRDVDGIIRYQLTHNGQIQWIIEKQLEARKK